jgi:hypothetical protein
MRQRKAFFPSAIGLEPRVLLSRAGGRGPSVVVSGLYPGHQVLNRRQQPVIAEVNQSFDTFKSDYGQARATYFSSILGQPVVNAAAMQAFQLYTRQRVALLGQQIISSFLQTPQGTARAKGQPETLRVLVSNKIIGPQGQTPPGSLAQSLLDTIPLPGTPAPTQSLFSLSQDNAIEAARVAVINGVNIVKNGDFGNKTHSHH